MKLHKVANYYVTLGVFLMLTIAVVASQARATQQRQLAELGSAVENVAGQAVINVTLRLDNGNRVEALQGHN